MMLRRFFIGSVRHLEYILKSQIINIDDILRKDLSEIYSLNADSSRKLSLVLYKNFKKDEKFEKFNQALQSHLTELLPCMSVFQRILLYKNLGQGIDKKATFSKPFLELMIQNLGVCSSLDFKSNQVLPLIKFIPIFIENNIEYESHFISYFSTLSKSSLMSMRPDDQSNLELILTRIGNINKFFDVKIENSESIYTILIEKIGNRFDSMSITEIFSSLRCLIINDRGDEDFIRKLEKKIMMNLSYLHEKSLADLLNIYSKRILYNADYIITSIYQPIYEEIINRFEFFTPKTLSYILFNYWRNSAVHGMYCDEGLKNKIANKCRNLESFDDLDAQTRSFLIQNILSYLSHARQLDSEIIISLLKFESRFRNGLDAKFYLRSVNYLSRTGHVFPIFVEKFKESFNILMKDSENYLTIYIIWLNFKHLCSNGTGDLEDVYTNDVLDQLIKHRKEKTERFTKIQSQYHSELTTALTKLNVEHVNEYYDEFFFDIALPAEKICIEISGPGHYLFPSLQYNGRFANRKVIIEKLGWKYCNYSSMDIMGCRNSVYNFLHMILPFHIND